MTESLVGRNGTVAGYPTGHDRSSVDELYGFFERPAWMEHAACRGKPVSLFFPERGEFTAEAKSVCAGCGVKDDCREFAVTTGQRFGIWGMSSERERRVLRKRQAVARS